MEERRGKGTSDPVEADSEFTRILSLARGGDAGAADRLYALAYPELRRMAGRQLGSSGGTLNPTALVNEAYVKLAGAHGNLADQRHFMAVASRAMRQVTVDYARARLADKRGAGARAVTLDEEGRKALRLESDIVALVDLDEALRRLADLDPRLARVVELRFFGGLSVLETAEVLKVSIPTIKRDSRTARAFLQRELSS